MKSNGRLPLFMYYRREIMGFAMIWIVFFHMQFHPANSFLEFIKGIGYGGVDLLTLISGYGISFSLSERTLSDYVKRRISRIIPKYYIILIFYSFIRICNFQMSIPELLGNITLIGFFVGMKNQFSWYITFLLVIYTIAPFWFSIKSKAAIGLVWVWIILVGIASFDTDFLLINSRLPVFFIGMSLYRVMEEGKIKLEEKYCKGNYSFIYVIAILGMLVLYYFYNYRLKLLWNKGAYWYPFIFITPGLLLILAIVFDTFRLCHMDIINRFFRTIGDASWDIFLIHVLMFDTVCQVYMKMTSSKWVVVGILCILGGVMINGIERGYKTKNIQ